MVTYGSPAYLMFIYKPELMQTLGNSTQKNIIQRIVSILLGNTIGIHGDNKSWKLVSCVFGEIQQVVVDMRKDSASYLMWQDFIINDITCKSRNNKKD